MSAALSNAAASHFGDTASTYRAACRQHFHLGAPAVHPIDVIAAAIGDSGRLGNVAPATVMDERERRAPALARALVVAPSGSVGGYRRPLLGDA